MRKSIRRGLELAIHDRASSNIALVAAHATPIVAARVPHESTPKGSPMNADLVKLPTARSSAEGLSKLESAHRQSAASRAANGTAPPSFLVDEIAREEWEKVSASLIGQGAPSLALCSLLAGYCNAVARAVRAEQTLAVEGRYYETRTRRGSLMRRRHPAAQDAEEGWTAARHLAKQLGLTGGPLVDRRGEDSRRRVFK
jgi:P27 family predicted phage terminase small subunit